MNFKISYIFIFYVTCLCIESIGSVRLFFYNNLPYTPQELVEIGTGSLFYAGELDHVPAFTCTSGSNNTVIWYDSTGKEVSTGNGSGNALYWTGLSWNKTLHITNNTGGSLLNELNDGNNFTCQVNETNDSKVIGIYYIRSLPDPENSSVPFNAKGFRLFFNDTPPTVHEFTLQRGSFAIDRNTISKVQSLLPANLSFAPALTNRDSRTTASTIYNPQFNTSSICQIVGQDLFDSVYIGFSDQPFLLAQADTITDYPTFPDSYCIRNGTVAFKYRIGLNSSSIRVDCPLVFNAQFIDINNLNLDINTSQNSFQASIQPEKRRLWIDFTEQTPVTLKFDREYVCEDKYEKRVSFRVHVLANGPIQVYDSDDSTSAALNDSSYVRSLNGIPSTLYCLSGDASTDVKWYRDTGMNRSASQSIELVDSTGDVYPIAHSSRIGRSDLTLNGTIASGREGYYYCGDGKNLSLKFGIFSQPPLAPITTILPNICNLQVIIGEYPQLLICGNTNAPHPPPTSNWIGPLYAGNAYLYTGALLEANSGIFTCVTSNVVSSSTRTVYIAVFPPPPRLIESHVEVETIFVSNSFQISCEFSTFMNVTPCFSVDWYHNGSQLNASSINTTLYENTHTVESILSVLSPSLSQSGYYSCIARVGGSSTTNITSYVPIYPVYLPDSISLTVTSLTHKRVTLSWNATAMLSPLTESYTIFYKRSADSTFMNISSLNTSLTIYGLSSNTEYEVYVNANNQFGSRRGPSLVFLTERIRLFFTRNGEAVPFVSGSIFRGGNQIREAVTDFHCAPDSSSQQVTWYHPNGGVIPFGVSSVSGLHHTVDSSTGVSTLHTMNSVTQENEGNNFTCIISSSSLVLGRYHFGIYHAEAESSELNVNGVRLTDPDDLIYEFVYQNGVFDFDYSRVYNVECLSLVEMTSYWHFIPFLISSTNISTLDELLPDVRFDPNSLCQLVRCAPFVQYAVFSNQPFLLKTDIDVDIFFSLKCIPDNTVEYTFEIGDSLDIIITCPLVFDARFLDISPNEFALLNTSLALGNPRRLWVNGTITKAKIHHDREYVCEDKYEKRVSFRVHVLANGPIQVYDSDDSTNAALNDSSYVRSLNGIPSTLYCLSGDASANVKWYRDTGMNRSASQSIELVDSTGDVYPIAHSSRIGRSDLTLNGTIASGREGYYYCGDGSDIFIRIGLFRNIPVAPIAQVYPNTSTLEIVIGVSVPILMCYAENLAYPPPTMSWTLHNSVILNAPMLDTDVLLEVDSGLYSCNTYNIIGFSTYTVNISIVPPPPRVLSNQLLTPAPLFTDSAFQISCEFSTFMNVTPLFTVDWYHNGSQLNASSINTTLYENTHTVESILSVLSPSLSQSGYYSCIARVGGSSTTNITSYVPIYPVYLPDSISLTVTSLTHKRVTLSWNATAMLSPLTESYTIFYKRSADSTFMNISSLNTSLTIYGLSSNTEYEVYVNASNQFGSRRGPSLVFLTERIRLFFTRNGEAVPFVSGSIFRGGNQIREAVTDFHCAPDSSSQQVTWYQPNGGVIPFGVSSVSGLHHTLDSSTGVSTLHTMNSVTQENEGNNFTCIISSSSLVLGRYHFGIYHAEAESSELNVNGVRLTDPDDLIYEFVYQNGVFDFDYSRVYNVECLSLVEMTSYWHFIPFLISSTNISTLDELLPDVRFDPNSLCQLVRCAPFVQYAVFSNQPFLLKTDIDVDIFFSLKCIPDNTVEYTFEIGDSLDIIITCPLVFDARFLDISPNEFALLNTSLALGNPRRLWVNGTITKAKIHHDREYVCEDKYEKRVSFRVHVLANGPIQVYDSDDGTSAALNDSSYVRSLNGIPSTLYCLSGDASTDVKWYRDTGTNRSASQSIELVDSTGDVYPIAHSSRIGRSDLTLNGTIASGREGYYYCGDGKNLSLKFAVFSQPPLPPSAFIIPQVSVLYVTVGSYTPTVTCTTDNSPHPPPIAYWLNQISYNTSHLNTADLLENNSGVFTCVTSNVVGESSADIVIQVIPPPPILVNHSLITARPIYQNDSFAIFCEFATFLNITSNITVFWYQNSSLLLNSSSTSITEFRNVGRVRSVLTVWNSVASQSGAYTCRSHVGASQTSNSSAIFLIFDQTPPPTLDYFFLQTSETIFFRNPLSFSCQFRTFSKFLPYLVIEWYHNETLITTSKDVQIVESYRAESSLSTLTVSNSNYSHSGAYYCAGNILGVIANSSAISVSVIPFVTLSNSSIGSPQQRIYIEESLSLFCEFFILPSLAPTVSVTWFHNSTLLNTCCNSGITIKTDINQFTGLVRGILDVSTAYNCHAGEYYCIARSKHANSTDSEVYRVAFDPSKLFSYLYSNYYVVVTIILSSPLSTKYTEPERYLQQRTTILLGRLASLQSSNSR